MKYWFGDFVDFDGGDFVWLLLIVMVVDVKVGGDVCEMLVKFIVLLIEVGMFEMYCIVIDDVVCCWWFEF